MAKLSDTKKNFIPLESKKIQALINTSKRDLPIFHLLTEVSSTNDFLKQLPATRAIQLCCAEKQTAGRGRFGRVWQSPFGENIYFSMLLPINKEINSLSGLSIVIGLATIKSLSALTNSVMLKWPNDLLWQNKKLGGILLESKNSTPRSTDLIIGIGLNINSDPKYGALAETPWCSLYEITEHYVDRNTIVAFLYQNLVAYIQQFLKEGFKCFKTELQNFDYLLDKQIEIHQKDKTIKGKARGIDRLGQLIIEDFQGVRHYFLSGDTSISGFVPS